MGPLNPPGPIRVRAGSKAGAVHDAVCGRPHRYLLALAPDNHGDLPRTEQTAHLPQAVELLVDLQGT